MEIEKLRDIVKEKVNKDITDQVANDKEFYYIAGQCINFMCYRYCNINKCLKENLVSKSTMLSKNALELKKRLKMLYMKCNNMLYLDDKKFNNAFSMLMLYNTKDKNIDEQYLNLGYLENCILK